MRKLRVARSSQPWLHRLCSLLCCTALGCAAPRAPLPGPTLPLVTTPDAEFRMHPPPPPPLVVDAPPVVETATLPNGLAVWVVPRPGATTVSLSIIASRGGFFDTQYAPELIGLTSRAVAEAGLVWSDASIIEPPSLNGESVSFEVGPGYARFELPVPAAGVDVGMSILARSVRHVAIGRVNLDLVRLADVKAMLDGVGNSSLMLKVALEGGYTRAAADRMVPMDHFAVRNASDDAIAACYRDIFRPESLALMAIGPVSLEQIRALAERELGTWVGSPATTASAPALSLTPTSKGRSLHFFPVGEHFQPHVLLLQSAPGPARPHDELPFALLAEIAAGSFRSRANARLRHHGGITYGVRPRMLHLPTSGLLVVEAAFETGELAAALKDLLAELELMREQPVSAEELRDAKLALAADFARRTGGSSGLARELGELYAQGRDADWLARFPDDLEAVSVADVQRVARTYLRPDDVEIGVVGPASLANDLSVLGRVSYYSAKVR